MKRKLLSIFALATICSGISFGQVTVGDKTPPAPGALLDLKERSDGTSDRGLGIPRVKLTERGNLFPMFEKTPGNGIANGDYDTPVKKTAEDDKHIGLVVYNVDKCAVDGDGIYVWSGTEWTKIGEKFLAGLNLSTAKLSFWNGIANTAQTVDVSWGAPGAGLVVAPTYTASGLTFTSSPASGTLANSPEAVSFKPNNMTAAELNTNLFAKKSGQITFSFQNSPCAGGGIQTKAVDVTQINKGVKVNGRIDPAMVMVAATSNSMLATVQSNAKWKVSIFPTTNPAVSNLSQASGGTEIEDGSPTPAITNVNYDVTVGPNKSRYNYLTFSDQHSPKRFNDVVLTVAQCAGDTDLTMEQYKDLWEQMYGLDPNNDEPDSDGDVVKNKNKVRWHYDQDGNIFFSGMFGTERWMLNNLAAKTYASDVASPPTLTCTYNNSNTDAYYGYPNTQGTTNAGLTTLYDKIQRLGLLYNWQAATGNQNNSTANQLNANHGPHQGICPNGWHLPSDKEWTDLETTLKASPTQWSSNTIGNNTVETIKDMCEPTIGIGKSFGILDGGFNAFSAGYASGGSASSYQSYGFFWSASSYGSSSAWSRYFNTGGGAVTQGSLTRNTLFSVRCKK